MRVLIVEDHDEVSDLVRRALERDGHEVTIAPNAQDADARLGEQPIDAAVLDLGLPDGHGLAWCQSVRARGVGFPILVLTAQSAVAVRVAAFDAGADDFLAKPFAVAELRARIRALGRRGPLLPGDRSFGDVRIDVAARRAWVKGEEVTLTAREWRVVELLISRGGHMVPRADIVGTIWGEQTASAEASLEVIVARIRKKLGSTFIRTMRRGGYAIG